MHSYYLFNILSKTLNTNLNCKRNNYLLSNPNNMYILYIVYKI